MNDRMATPDTRTAPATRDPITLWLVEDNGQYRNAIVKLLHHAPDLRCTQTFSQCEDMLELLHQGEAPEVILVDIGLPGMDGIEGIRRLKTISPSTEAIILTVHDEDESVFRAICAGASGYLLKDAPAESILEAIHEVLGGGAPMNGHIARRVLEMFAKSSISKADYGLTQREKEILQHLTDGLTKKQIGNALFLSVHTVDTHFKNIYVKLQVHTRSSAVAKALKERLI